MQFKNVENIHFRFDTLKRAIFKKFGVYFLAENSNVVEITKESLTIEKTHLYRHSIPNYKVEKFSFQFL